MDSALVMAQNEAEKLVYHTNGISYVPDVLKHRYGESKRKPLEDWFLDELRFFEANYPQHKIFTLGSSLVFGEKFITYLTVCEFEIKDEEAFPRLVHALRASDQAIRRKLSAMWKWDAAARLDKSIVFIVGWLDFAYFLQHRNDFLDRLHNRYMGSFIEDQSAITAKHYKVFCDGSIAPFDHTKLSPDDAAVYNNPTAIQYQRISAETLV